MTGKDICPSSRKRESVCGHFNYDISFKERAHLIITGIEKRQFKLGSLFFKTGISRKCNIRLLEEEKEIGKFTDNFPFLFTQSRLTQNIYHHPPMSVAAGVLPARFFVEHDPAVLYDCVCISPGKDALSFFDSLRTSGISLNITENIIHI